MKPRVTDNNTLTSFSSLCYGMFGDRINRLYSILDRLRPVMVKSGMHVDFKEYVCLMCFLSILSSGGSLLALSILNLHGFLFYLPFPDVSRYIVSFSVGAITFLILYLTPFRKAMVSRRQIETLLPVTSSYMSVLASATIPPEKIIHTVAAADPRIVLTKEFNSIVVKNTLLGSNILISLDKAAQRSPSEFYAKFLRELASTIKSGGSIKTYFMSKTNQLLERRNLRIEHFLKTLELVGEMAVLIFTVFPLMLIIMLSMMSSLGGIVAGFNIRFLMYLITFLVIPILSGFYLLILDLIHSNELNLSSNSKVPKQRDMEISIATKRLNTNLLIASLSPVLFVSMLMLGLLFAPASFTLNSFQTTLSISLTLQHFLILGLILALAPPSIIFYSKNKRGAAVDDNLPILLRNVAEAGAIGLTLRKAIELSAEHDYGPITKELRKVVVALSWRVPLEKALISFGERCDTQLARTVAFLISEANRVGGKIKDSIETIITHVQELQNQERRMRLQMKPQVGIIYIAFTVFLVITYILSQQLFPAMGGAPGIGINQGLNIQMDFKDIQFIFFYMAIIEGFFSGLAGGKLSTGSIKNGFIHSIALCTLALVVFTIM